MNRQLTLLKLRQAALRLKYDVVLPAPELLPLPTPMDTLISNWGVPFLGINDDYIQSNAKQPVAVFVLDTVDETQHPGLAGIVEPKWSANFTNSPSGAVQHHGTHVAGTVGAAPAPTGGKLGVARALYDANMRLCGCSTPLLRIGLVKVLNDQGAGAYGWIASGIRHVIDIATDEPGIRFVINMSLGGSAPNTDLAQAINEAELAGITVICAAGNDGHRTGESRVNYPGKYPNTWAIGACDQEGEWATFSSTGPEVTLSMPGVQIMSTYGANNYAALNGTSMASPHASAMAAILLSLYPDLDPHELRDYVLAHIEDAGNPGHDIFFGYGIAKFGAYRENPYSETPPPPPPPPTEPEPNRGCLARLWPFK